MISHIHILFLFLQFPSIPATTSLPGCTCFFHFFNTSWHHLVLGCISMGLEPSTSAWIAFQGPNIWRKKTLPPSEAYNCTYIFSFVGGASWYHPKSKMGFCLTWSRHSPPLPPWSLSSGWGYDINVSFIYESARLLFFARLFVVYLYINTIYSWKKLLW